MQKTTIIVSLKVKIPRNRIATNQQQSPSTNEKSLAKPSSEEWLD